MGTDPDSVTWITGQIERHQTQLLNFAHAILGSRELAEDVVQEAFVICFERLDKLDKRDAKYWLIKVCRNLALDIKRKQKTEQQLATRASGGESFGSFEFKSDKDPSVVHKTSFETIVRLLDAKHRDVVLLRFQLDLSYREIAKVTGYSEGNVGFIIHQAIEILRKGFEKEGLL